MLAKKTSRVTGHMPADISVLTPAEDRVRVTLLDALRPMADQNSAAAGADDSPAIRQFQHAVDLVAVMAGDEHGRGPIAHASPASGRSAKPSASSATTE